MDYTDTSETETDAQSEYFNGSKRGKSDSESDDDLAPSNFEDGKPVQLIRLGKKSEDNLKLTLDTKALDNVLETCGDRRICIITTVGGDRTGKSFLLNCIKDNLKSREIDSKTTRNARGSKPIYKGFNFKAGYKPVTKGIWIWNKAFIVEGEDRDDVAVILMDTEGINDELSKPDEIAAILGIPLLSSSIFILNLSGNLSSAPFDCLHKFVGNGKKQSNLTLYQKLSVLVHDWTNISTLKLGERGGKKYFEKFSKNNFHQVTPITSAFEAVECFLLPNIGEKAIQSSFSGKSADLSKEFSKYLQRYLSQLLNSDKLCSKKIVDFEVKPQDFKLFFEAYVAFFNNPSEMEAGISQDAITTLTRNTARKIQVDRGIEEYHKMFKQRKKNSRGGFFRESTINGLHVQARKKALQASKIFSFSKEEQKQFELELDAEINKEKKDMQSENISARKMKIRRCIEKATDELKEELDRKFPCKSEPGVQMPNNLVFYDEKDLERTVEQVMGNITTEFLEEFLGDDEDELAVLEAKLNKVLVALGDEFVQTNQENKNRATYKVESVVDKLVDEYKAGMQKKICRLRKLDSGTLSVFHDDVVERMEQKFEAVQLGTEFKAEWWGKLVEILEGEHLKLQCNLESTMAEAMEMMAEEEAAYKQLLSDNSTTMEEDEKILKFHEKNRKRILKEFQDKNPFPTGSPKHNLVEQTLLKNLNSIYTTLIEKGLLVKRKQQECLEKASDKTFNIFCAELDKCLKAEYFMYTDECRNYLTTAYQKAISRYEKEVAESAGTLEKEIFEEQKSKFELKCKQFLKNWQKINEERHNQAVVDAEKLLEGSVQIYEAEMHKKLKSFGSMEDLTEKHNKLQIEIGENFRQKLPSPKKSLVDKYIQKLNLKLKEIADELSYLLESKIKAEDFAVREAFHDCRNYYTENMEKAFNTNTVGYFTDQQFEQINTQFRDRALQKINANPPLSSSQLTILEERLNKLYEKFEEKNDLIRRSYADEDIAIGIDLGTTYCCVGVYHMGKVKILANELGSNTTPSYVCIHADGTTTVGITAKEQAYRHPESTIFDAKRIIGRRIDDEKLQEDMKYWPFTVVEHEGKTSIKVHDKFYDPEDISSMILKHLKEEAEQFLKREVKKAVITVPAYFTDGQRQATIDAGELAGLNVLAILNEPTAAAVAYRLELYTVGKPKKILVYDLGGGTFDVAVLEISEDKLDVLSISGDSHLGGEDFDKNLMTYCAEEYKKEKAGFDLLKGKDSTEKTTRDDVRRRLKRLQFYCENNKKGLACSKSLEAATIISIDEIKRGHDLNLRITRKDFDERNQALFDKTIKIMDDALKSANLRKDDIDDIVLVGGSTRIAKLQEMLADHFNGRPINQQVNPDEAVAYGAAVQAAILNAKPGTKVFDFGQIQEITPMSLGIEIANKDMDIIIRKGTKIPYSHTEEYRTSKDDQTTVRISVYQGEEKEAEKNKLLGNFNLEGIPKNREGKEVVEVTMTINLNGILSVEAVCKSTQGRKSITISDDRGRRRTENKAEKKKLLAEAS